MSVEVSIIIPSFNGKNKLERCLQSVLQQNHLSFEVLLVLDFSTDDSENYLTENFKTEISSKKLKIEKNEVKGRSAARNYGALKASGNFLFFLDNDMLLEPNCLSEHLNRIVKNEKYVSIGTQLNYNSEENNDFLNYKIQLSKIQNEELKNKTQPFTKDNLFFNSANFLIHKNTFAKIKGFNEQLHFQEDYELGLRLLEENCQIVYNANAVGYHFETISIDYLIKQEKGYILGRKQTHNFTNPKPLSRILHKLMVLSGLKTISLKTNFLKLFPQKIRYKLYSHLIYAHAST